MIEFRNVYKSYEGKQPVLKNLHFTCRKGEITVLIGPSGCGKTTTLKLINRLITPTKGTIRIDGENIAHVSPVELRRRIGYVIQHIGLFPHMTIGENVAVVPKLLKWDTNKIERRVDELLHLVGLEPKIYKNRKPKELSGGQQQRVGVIRALAADPPIILMDEPFSALDPISREQLQAELIRLQQEINKTIVFVTHDMDEALKIADQIVLMKDGEIVQHASPEEILRRPKNEFVINFIGRKRLKQEDHIPTVAEMMLTNPATIAEDKGMAVAMSLMETRRVDSLVVVNKQNQIQGYVSIYDVTQQFADETKLVKDIMRPFKKVIEPTAPLSLAIHLLDDTNLSYIPVAGKNNELLGVLTRGSVVGHFKTVYTLDGSRGA